MHDPKDPVARALLNILSGRGAHVDAISALDGLDWQVAGERPDGAPHSIFQVLNHMIYWQELCLQALRGEKTATPKHAAEGWPGAQRSQSSEQWQATVARFKRGLDEAMAEARNTELHNIPSAWKDMTNIEVLQVIASHNSYHLGQVVLGRRMLGAWPPPAGGDTW